MTVPSWKKSAATPFRVFVLVICAAVVAVVMAALFIAGSPAEQRVRRLDETRVNDLRQLHYAVDNFYADHHGLPTTLEEVKDPRYGAYRFVDPETALPYEYSQVQKTTYQLCATFSLDSNASTNANDPRFDPRLAKPIYPTEESFDHGVGRTCFTFNAALSQLGFCAVDVSCPVGNECVSLPNVGTRCVPTGKACEIAGCADENSCVLAESYPPQVRCVTPDNQPAAIQTPPADENTCALYKPAKGGAVSCYGCANGRCSKPPTGSTLYAPAKDSAGIPYACFAGENGCELAQ